MIAGIHGKKGSGKDTLLDRMESIEPGLFVRFSFAGLLKESVCRLFDITRAELELMKNDPDATVTLQWTREDGVKESRRMPMRVFLQRYGTEAHREVFGDDFWVDLALDEAIKQAGEGRIPVFTDVRFPNEAEAVRLHDGAVIHVIGPDDDGDRHPSEVPLPSHLIDLTVENKVRDDGFRRLDEVAHEAVELLQGARHEPA